MKRYITGIVLALTIGTVALEQFVAQPTPVAACTAEVAEEVSLVLDRVVIYTYSWNNQIFITFYSDGTCEVFIEGYGVYAYALDGTYEHNPPLVYELMSPIDYIYFILIWASVLTGWVIIP